MAGERHGMCELALRVYDHIDENETVNCLPEFCTAEIMPRQHFLTLASWLILPGRQTSLSGQ
jgi:hypothetical protein